VHVWELPGADGASLGTISVEVDAVGPQLGDEARGPLCDLVVHGTGLGMPRSTAPGGVI
jgi:hypothetical protein